MNCQAPYKAGYEYGNSVFDPLYTALFRLLCTASGHLPGKGNYMRTPKEFDYLLWTEKGDTTRYYVKLKSTGETTDANTDANEPFARRIQTSKTVYLNQGNGRLNQAKQRQAIQYNWIKPY